MKVLQFIILTSFSLVHIVFGACPNNCNGRGQCNKYGRCECAKGFQAADCSERLCPFGIAWADAAEGTDNAHKSAECSNKGLCNRETGKCQCLPGFTGSACERLECEGDCFGFGKCTTIREFSRETRDDFSRSFSYENIWDAKKIQRCNCDLGRGGYDCSESLCQTGDDPLTTGQVNEVQLLKCIATAGSFVLFYKGLPSKNIPFDASPKVMEDAIEHIPIISNVKVEFSQASGTACQVDKNVIQITFMEQFGPQPPLVAQMDDTMVMAGGAIYIAADGVTCYDDKDGTVFKSIKGTKENDNCAGRGYCDTDDGTCYCYDTNGDVYLSSDGYGNPGTRGDCGYAKTKVVGSCPGFLQCSGHGVCDQKTFRCSCSEGWSGGDCSERDCPKGLSWASYPTANDESHTVYATCSDMGICDRESGKCKCQSAFYGEACEYMTCNGALENQCNGHGRCMSMSELATWAVDNGDATSYTYGKDPNKPHTWDAHRIFGCLCDVGYTGYDCSLRDCPRGDDPGTYDDSVEIQLIKCVADGGTFRLGFRQQGSTPIAFDASAADVKASLETMSSLSSLTVTFLNTSSAPSGDLHVPVAACSTSGDTIIKVQFDTTHGDLPALKLFTQVLRDDTNSNGNDGTGTLQIAVDGHTLGGYTSVKGTTETDYCNNRGICDQSTGKCHCFLNWASSDGKGNPGDIGDCGYRNQFNTNGGKVPEDNAKLFQKEIRNGE